MFICVCMRVFYVHFLSLGCYYVLYIFSCVLFKFVFIKLNEVQWETILVFFSPYFLSFECVSSYVLMFLCFFFLFSFFPISFSTHL
jgi:hypothetical protein